MALYDNRICRQCGASFKGGPRAWYCEPCRAERARERQRKASSKQIRPLGSTDICIVCKKEYIVNGGMQKYCTDCAPIQIKINDRKQGLQYYHANKDIINPRRYNRLKLMRSELNVTGAVMHIVSGEKWVYWHKYNKVWVSYIKHDKKRYHLGSFKSKAAAVKTSREAEAAAKEGSLDQYIALTKKRAAARKRNAQNKEYRQAYYQQNADKIKAYGSAHYKNNKEKAYARNRKWMEEHPERAKVLIRRSHEKYYEKNRDEIIAKKIQYNSRREAENPEKIKEARMAYYQKNRDKILARQKLYNLRKKEMENGKNTID